MLAILLFIELYMNKKLPNLSELPLDLHLEWQLRFEFSKE